MELRLDGKTALVTGASGGLGRHFAKVLAAAGATVVVTARRTDKLHETVAEIGEARAHAFPMDVTDAASVAAGFQAAEATIGRPIDILVNNAGLAITTPALETTPSDWSTVIDTNLTGAFHVAREAASRMAKSGGGSIVNIASIVGLRPAGAVASYAASKAGLIHLTKALALELARITCE